MNSLVINTEASQLKASVTVENPITIKEPVNIANKSLNVVMSESKFISDKSYFMETSGEGYIFEGKDISGLKTATIFIDNIGLNSMVISLQLSPDGILYIDDVNYTNIIVEPGQKSIIVVNTFAHCIRLKYNIEEGSTTFNAYYNAQA